MINTKIYKTLLLLLLFVFCLCACEKGGQGTDTTAEQEGSTEVSAEDIFAESLPFIVNGESNYKIVCGYKTVAANEAVQDFIKNVSRRTGTTLTVGSSLRPADGPEIVIGEIANRDASVTASKDLFYDEFRVCLIDGNVYIGLLNDQFLGDALKEVEHALIKSDAENWTLSTDLFCEKIYSERTETVPLFETEGKQDGIYSCGNGDYEVSFSAVKSAEVDLYQTELANAGYSVYAENAIGENRFVTLYKGDTGVHLSYYPSKSFCKVIFGPKGFLPETVKPTVSATVSPSVTQPARLGAESGAPGMSYVLQTSDGGFILIDGGPSNSADAESLLAFLKESTPAGQKPLIHAWIFTHAHGDHVQLATDFLQKYYNEITLELVCGNFPDFDTIRFTNESVSDTYGHAVSLESALKSRYPDTPWYKFHTGQKFYLADAEVEILYTHEDYFPEKFAWGNDTSAAFRITLGDKEMIFLGDCDPLLCQFMADVYADELKCDILQLAHHGFNGAVLKLYQVCDPDICFWAVDGERFANDPRCLGTEEEYEFNAWIRDPSIKQREHYHASTTTTILLG